MSDLDRSAYALERQQTWLRHVPRDAAIYSALVALTDNETARTEAFHTDLEFGTGGLRGILGPGTNRMNDYTVGQATQGLANYLTHPLEGTPARTALRVCIAFDTRRCSRAFALRAAGVLCGNGISVDLYRSPRPTPMLSFAVRRAQRPAQAGIVITASHNPPEYNGYKVYNGAGCQLTDDAATAVLAEIKNLDPFGKVKFLDPAEAEAKGLLTYLGDETDRAYLDALREQLARLQPALVREHARELRMIYTPLHGSGRVPVETLLKQLGYPLLLVQDQADEDENFRTVEKPNPEEAAVFTLAQTEAAAFQPQVIFATDPDADRIGVMARPGKGADYEILTGNQTGALLCHYIITTLENEKRLPANAAVVKTIVTGTLVNRICAKYKVAVRDMLTGFKYIGEQMDLWQESGEKTFLFGLEESYGYLFGDVSRDKDAVISAAMIAEMALWYQQTGLTLVDALAELYREFGPVAEDLINHEVKGTDGVARIQALMDRARRDFRTILEGEQVVAAEDYLTRKRLDLSSGEETLLTLPQSNVLKLFYANGEWLTLRPSGTEPKIKLYLCSNEAYPKGATIQQAQDRVAELKKKAQAFLDRP
ncbi:MAG: phospho-sugar mutase [Oscillospiraceae bacterium]|jgi:phosphoglucomutase|nr:phospho-sugar mutase [Oscillospiraceae bacterium]